MLLALKIQNYYMSFDFGNLYIMYEPTHKVKKVWWIRVLNKFYLFSYDYSTILNG